MIKRQKKKSKESIGFRIPSDFELVPLSKHLFN